MSELLNRYFPENVKPYDPSLAEAIKGREQEILDQAQTIIRAAGVVQLPNRRKGTTALIMGGDIIVQAFSSVDDIVFQTIIKIVGKRDGFVKEHINDNEFKIFEVMVNSGNDSPIFLTFLNSVKFSLYQKLLAEDLDEKRSYTAADFEREEFVKTTPTNIKELIKKYLESKPRQDLADEHFNKLTLPGFALPGAGLIEKLY